MSRGKPIRAASTPAESPQESETPEALTRTHGGGESGSGTALDAKEAERDRLAEAVRRRVAIEQRAIEARLFGKPCTCRECLEADAREAGRGFDWY